MLIRLEPKAGLGIESLQMNLFSFDSCQEESVVYIPHQPETDVKRRTNVNAIICAALPSRRSRVANLRQNVEKKGALSEAPLPGEVPKE